MSEWPVIQRWTRKQGRPVTISEIAEHLKLTHAVALSKVVKLVEAGELVDLGGDQITVPPPKRDQPPEEAPPMQAKIWTAICNRDLKGGAWTAKDIARIAEASLNYTQYYLAWLRKQGHLTAHRKPPAPYRHRLHPDAPPISEPPIWWNKRNRAIRRRQKEKACAAQRPPAPRRSANRPRQPKEDAPMK